VFDAHDATSEFTCSDGVCPSGETCVEGFCEAIPSSSNPVGTCGNPIPITPDPVNAVTGDNGGRKDTIEATCTVHDLVGPDVVFELDAGGTLQVGSHIELEFTSDVGNTSYVAYMLSACESLPAMPMCTGDVFASFDSPVALTLITLPQFIVVDSTSPTTTGMFNLKVFQID
jgi:hypothetical protein